MTFWGVPIAYAIRPSPDEHLLAGVPEADRTLYDYCYGDAVRAVHVKWAWIGLATLVLLSMIGGLIVYSMQRSNFN